MNMWSFSINIYVKTRYTHTCIKKVKIPID